MLEIILGFKVPKVSVHVEHSILISSDFRSVRLDVYASDELKVGYDIKLKRFLQRCRWDFVIRSFKAVKSNHDRELTMERFQKRRYVPVNNLTVLKTPKISKVS